MTGVRDEIGADSRQYVMCGFPGIARCSPRRFKKGCETGMRAVCARYNAKYNSIDVTTFQGYVLRLDCGKVEKRLRLTPGGQCELNALAIDEPLQYVVMALEGSMQSRVDCGE